MKTDGDIHLSQMIRVYEGALSSDTCKRIIELFESDSQGQFRRQRQNSWVEYIISRNRLEAWHQYEALLLDSMTRYLRDYSEAMECKLFGPNGERAFEHLKLKKYCARTKNPDHFPKHFDAFDNKTCVRMVGFLWYLNTVDVGGETEFPKLGRSIIPKAGRLAIFPPMWMFEHVGRPPISNDKYVVTSYLNFRDLEDDYRYSYPLR
jgi:hypothetical protein